MATARPYPKLTLEDRAALRAQPPAVLAMWWCELNTYYWPSGLPGSPEVWMEKGPTRGSSIMRWIEFAVGRYEILRFWNVEYRKDMTDEEFAAWWHRECGTPMFWDADL